MEEAVTVKFWLLQSAYDFFIGIGMGSGLANAITFIIACLAILGVAWVLYYLGSKILSIVVGVSVKHSVTRWESFFVDRKLYKRLMHLVIGIILLATASVFLRGFSEKLVKYSLVVISVYLTFVIVKLIYSLLDVINDIYETRPQAKMRSIKSVLQTIKIVVGVVAALIIISILIGENPKNILLGLGASAAIISLIFKDTILGFVASIQISAQDMIRPGDWIEMPTKGADGMVADINVTSVKVRNWDNSITMIPIYSMVSDSFTNWRNMEQSHGRRFRRPMLVDVNSIRTFTDAELEAVKNHKAVSPQVITKMMEFYNAGNTSDFMTNIGLFRCYVESYMHNHPKVSQSQMRVSRYLENTENGVIMQIYGYSREKSLVNYERVVSDIMEHIMIMASVFSIKLYQRPVASSEGYNPIFPDMPDFPDLPDLPDADTPE